MKRLVLLKIEGLGVWEDDLGPVRLMGFVLVSPLYGYFLYVLVSSDKEEF